MKQEIGIHYDLIGPEDQSQLVELIQDTFPEHEPMARALRLTRADYLPYTDLVAAKAVRERMTVVARLNGTRRFVGYCISEDFYQCPTYSMEKINPRMFPILDLLESLDRCIPAPAKAGEVFHLYMLGVLPEYARLGIGRRLIENSLRLARESGFQSAVAEATGPYSQRICEKMGFNERGAVHYAGFRHGGRAVFESIPAALACRLVELPLQRK